MLTNLWRKITAGKDRQTLSEKSIKIGLYLLIATFPLINRDLFSILNPQIFPSRVILVALLGIFLIVETGHAPSLRRNGSEPIRRDVAMLRLYKDVRRGIEKDPFLVLLLILWLVRLFSIVFSKNLSASLLLLAFYTSMVGLYLLLKKYFDFRLYKWHLLVVVTVGLFGILEVLWALQRTAFPGVLLGGNYIRVPATFYDANHLPVYLLTALPFLLVLFWQAKSLFRKTVLAGLIASLTLLLLSTFSRSGMIGFAAAFMIFWLLLLTFKYYKKALALGGVAAIVLVAVVLTAQTNYSLLQRAASVLNPAEKSTTAHETLLIGEWELFLEHPVLGVGYGGFSEAFRDSKWGREHLYTDPTGEIRLPAHSVWLEVLTETGILGFVPYFLAIGLVLLTMSKALRQARSKDFKLYLSALAAGLVGILTAGIFYSYNLEFFFFYVFFCYIFALKVSSSAGDSLPCLGVKGVKGEGGEENVAFLDLLLPASLAVLAGFFVFYKLGSTGLLDWDEAIYATVAKNILILKDPLTLHWIDSVPWFEKPPLYMWLSSIMIFFYGVTAFAPRFWSAFFGIGGVLVTYFFGRALFKSRLAGFLAALILATTTVYLYYSRSGMLDATFTFFMMLGLYFYWMFRARKDRRLAFFSGAAFGLAAMTKGFVVILPLGVIAVFEAFSFLGVKWVKRVRGVKELLQSKLPLLPLSPLLLLLLGFILVAAPWHLAMFAKYGREFFDGYFIYHVFKRGTEAIEGKSAPLLWYLTVIKVGFRIWAIPLLVAVPYAARKIYFGVKGGQRGEGAKEMLFVLIWAGVIFAFFTWAKSKLIWYIIPIYPVLALLNAGFFLSLVGWFAKLRLFKSLKLLKIVLAGGITLIGVFYVYLEKERVWPPDFTKEEVALIKIRNEADSRNNILFLLPGVASPVPRYYNDGPVREISTEELPEILHQNQQMHFLTTFSDYEALKDMLAKDNIELRLIGSYQSGGEMVLVERVLEI